MREEIQHRMIGNKSKCSIVDSLCNWSLREKQESWCHAGRVAGSFDFCLALPRNQRQLLLRCCWIFLRSLKQATSCCKAFCIWMKWIASVCKVDCRLLKSSFSWIWGVGPSKNGSPLHGRRFQILYHGYAERTRRYFWEICCHKSEAFVQENSDVFMSLWGESILRTSLRSCSDRRWTIHGW